MATPTPTPKLRAWMSSLNLLLLLTAQIFGFTAAFLPRHNPSKLLVRHGSFVSCLGATPSDLLGEWFLSEIGSLESSPGERRAVETQGGLDKLLVNHPAALRIEDEPSTRRKWLSAAGAILAATTAWSHRAKTSLAGELAPIAALPKLSDSAALCDPSISTFRNPSTGRIVHILGTAHISTDSAQLAGRVVREVRPDAVFLELDRKRITRALPQGDDSPSGGPGAGEKISLGMAARGAAADGGGAGVSDESSVPPPSEQQQSRGGIFGNPLQKAKERVLSASTKAVGDAIKAMYSSLGNQGFNPGEEFVLAIKEAMNNNAAVVLGDRDVDVTLRRLTEALSKTDLKKILSSDSELEQSLRNVMPDDLKSTMDGNTMTKDQLTTYVETVKARENVRAIMSQLKLHAPELYQAMVAERDEYMAKGLDSLDKFGTTVAVMGIAHSDGVEGNLRDRGWEQISIACPVR